MRRTSRQTIACIDGQNGADPRARCARNRGWMYGPARHVGATRSFRAREAILEKREVAQIDVPIAIHVGEAAAPSRRMTTPLSAPPGQTCRAGEEEQYRCRIGNDSIPHVIPARGVGVFEEPSGPDKFRITVGVWPLGDTGVDELTVHIPRVQFVPVEFEPVAVRNAWLDINVDDRKSIVTNHPDQALSDREMVVCGCVPESRKRYWYTSDLRTRDICLNAPFDEECFRRCEIRQRALVPVELSIRRRPPYSELHLLREPPRVDPPIGIKRPYTLPPNVLGENIPLVSDDSSDRSGRQHHENKISRTYHARAPPIPAACSLSRERCLESIQMYLWNLKKGLLR